MSSSPLNDGFTYPDLSMYGGTIPSGLWQPYHHDQSAPAAAAPVQAAVSVGAPSSPPFALDPALFGPCTLSSPAPAPAAPAAPPAPPAPPAPAAAPAPTPSAGLNTAPRLSAAGRQPFPRLFAGLQAPIELTSAVDIASWDEKIQVAFDNRRIGLRNNRMDRNSKSQKSRQSRARQGLKKLWEQAGGAPYVKGVPYQSG